MPDSYFELMFCDVCDEVTNHLNYTCQSCLEKSSKQPMRLLKWLTKVELEKRHYPMFKNIELNEFTLIDQWKSGMTPIEALNNLSTLS